MTIDNSHRERAQLIEEAAAKSLRYSLNRKGTVTGQQPSLEMEDYPESATILRAKSGGSGPIPPYSPSASGALEQVSEVIVRDEQLVPRRRL